MVPYAKPDDRAPVHVHRYEKIMATTPSGFWVSNAECRLLEVNEAYAQMSGYTRAELLGMRISDLEANETPDEILRHFQLIRDRRSDQFETRHRRRDGTLFDVAITASYLGAETDELVVFVQDITERKRAEWELKRSEEEFRHLLQHAPTGIYEIDYAGPCFKRVNDAMCRILGYTREELLNLSPFELLDEDSKRRFQERVRSVLSGNEIDDTVGFRVFAKNGREICAALSIKLTYTDGKPSGALVVAHDITERRRAEEALRTANEQLNEANRRKDEFLAMLAHELRNPLAVISSAAEILRTPEVPRAEVQKAQDAMSRQLRHMGRLIDDLLDVSRVTQGKILLKKEIVGLSSVVDGAIEATRRLIDNKQQKLFVFLPREPLLLDADPVRLAQSISNVLQNAAKYTPARGEIHLSAERANGDVVIRIRDKGMGIDTQLLPRIFDLFVQGDRAPDRAQGGLGIGLTMARSLLQLHGGNIEAFSPGLGQGSEFVIQLPLARVEAPDAPTVAKIAGVPSRRILVVDDNVDAVEMMRVLLEMEGHEIATANDGTAAIDAAAAFLPEIAFVDLGMPGMDGYELARRLKRDPTFSRIILVAVTGYGQEEDIQNSRRAGFDHHLVKPVALDAIRTLLT